MQKLLPLIKEKKELVDQALEKFLKSYHDDHAYQTKILAHNLFPGGKRLRPILAILLYEMCSTKSASKEFITRACALELIHISTLMLDDLPCMDNTDFRRNKPTTHKEFGEANAILMSLGLAAEAFAVLSQPFENVKDQEIMILTRAIAQKVGLNGLVGGQCADLTHGVHLEHCTTDQERLQYIILRKTAALFEASALIAAHLSAIDETQKQALLAYTRNFGIAFQIYDDICDINEDTVLTFPQIYGITQSHTLLKNHITQACAALSLFTHNTEPLFAIANFLVEKANEANN